MTVSEAAKKLGLDLVVKGSSWNSQVKGGFCSDMLSHVMGHCPAGYLWVTIQNHKNVIAICSLLEISGVVLAHGIKADKDMLEKAEDEGITVLASGLSAFEICGQLYDLGITGADKNG